MTNSYPDFYFQTGFWRKPNSHASQGGFSEFPYSRFGLIQNADWLPRPWGSPQCRGGSPCKAQQKLGRPNPPGDNCWRDGGRVSCKARGPRPGRPQQSRQWPRRPGGGDGPGSPCHGCHEHRGGPTRPAVSEAALRSRRQDRGARARSLGKNCAHGHRTELRP